MVLAGGKGSRMNELTRGKTPKCLLPIGNKPMLWFPLKMLENHGFAGEELNACLVMYASSRVRRIRQ